MLQRKNTWLLRAFALFKFSLASVNFKILFHKEATFRFLVSFGSLKMQFEIGLLLSFTNFNTIIAQYRVRKMKLGISKVPQSGHWFSELLLVRYIYLVKYEHEKCMELLTMYLTGIAGGGETILK